MIRNVFACLVHESRECVIDLVRNLHHLDPSSAILLYNGGPNPALLGPGFPTEDYNAIVHPAPKRLAWGRLHDFALDSMRFAIQNIAFDTLTIVDSDQLGTRPGYSECLSRALDGRAGIGLFSSSAEVLASTCQIGPVQVTFQEIDLWRPLLRRFPDGERKFAHWSFWPSTVFTADAARDLTRLFATDGQLQDIVRRTRIWATEEVILPTLTALLGYRIAPNPCCYDFVKYRVTFTPGHVEAALLRPDVYWLHPVARQYDDPLRRQIRNMFSGYGVNATAGDKPVAQVQSLPILQQMKRIEGWLEEDEGELLITAATRAITSLPAGSAVVEVGSFCGRATVVLGGVVKSLGAESLVYAIDRHDGRVGALDQGIRVTRPTLDIFRRNIGENGLRAVVRTVQSDSADVAWDMPIGMLLIDGLHDYPSVARDFHHFEKWLLPGGLVAFHDYADYFPGVKRFVDELLRTRRYQKVQCARSLMLLAKEQEDDDRGLEVIANDPLVSCIMPTADRRAFVPQAIRHFLRQDYPKRELIVLDDGADNIADLIPCHDQIRYLRLPVKRTMGAKHNLGCELARGEVIVHWDDDDWHADWRVSYQVQELTRQSQAALCGLSRLFFYEPGSGHAWEYVYPPGGKPWVSGGTFCYYKTFWERHRFPDMNEGADTVFVWNLNDANVVAHADHRFYIATVHANNTSAKRTHDPAWQRRTAAEVRRLIDDDSWTFYQQLAQVNSVGGLSKWA
jgi:hypothetical protein